MPPDPDRSQRVTLPTLQILAAFMADLKRDDWYCVEPRRRPAVARGHVAIL